MMLLCDDEGSAVLIVKVLIVKVLVITVLINVVLAIARAPHRRVRARDTQVDHVW